MEEAPSLPVSEPANPGKSRRRRQLSILIACVLIATALWFLRAFENEFTTRVEHPVRYVNMPTRMMTLDPLPQRISLEVKGLGFSVLKHNWNFSKTPLVVDIKRLKTIPSKRVKGFSEYLPMNQYINDFSLQLKDLSVQSVSPDTILLRFAVRRTKNLKVIPDFVYESGITPIPDSLIRIDPDSVAVEGPDLILDTLHTIMTLPIRINKKGTSLSRSLGLAEINNLVKSNSPKVNVTVNKGN